MATHNKETEDLELVPVPEIKRKAKRKPELSPTRIRTFLTCPTQYRLEYIDKIGRFYHRAQAGWAFGSTLHQTLQDFHQEGGAVHVSRDELVQRLESTWISSGYGDRQNEREHRIVAE